MNKLTYGELVERLGGKGISLKAAKSRLHPPSSKGDGQFDDQDRGQGNKSKRRLGKKVEKKSPTYLAYIHNKEV